jgi:hypothetical protein
MGVLFFVINAVFALVILLMVLWASVWALVSKNPDTRYQPMRDDRGSFIKSQTNLGTTELDALGATARGDPGKHGYAERKRMDLDDEEDGFSVSGSSAPTSQLGARPMAGGDRGMMKSPGPESYGAVPRSPVEPPSAPMLAGGGYGSPGFRNQSPVPPGSGSGYGSGYTSTRPGSQRSQLQPGGGARGQDGLRAANNASPWQRGVGY